MLTTNYAYRAIKTKYIGPTNTKGSRIKVGWADGEGPTLTRHWDSALNSEDNHCAAAFEFVMQKTDIDRGMDNRVTLEGGGTDVGAVFVIRYGRAVK